MNYSKMLFFAGFFMIVSQASAMENDAPGTGSGEDVNTAFEPKNNKQIIALMSGSDTNFPTKRTGDSNVITPKSQLQPKQVILLSKKEEKKENQLIFNTIRSTTKKSNKPKKYNTNNTNNTNNRQ